jgi:hypothetical protein
MLLGGILTGSQRGVSHRSGVVTSGTQIRSTRPSDATTSLQTLDAMAGLARETNLVVHVVVPRRAGVVERAREVARLLGLEVHADLRVHSVRVSFCPVKSAPTR